MSRPTPHWPDAARARPQASDDHAGQPARRGGTVIDALLAVVIGIAFAAWLFHWMACSQEAALCLAAAVPLRPGWWRRWRTAWRVQRKLGQYRRALQRAEIAAEWITDDQLLLATARADAADLYEQLLALERQS